MIAWLNGRLIEDAAPLTLTGPAFRCGMGVFETILHHARALPRFTRHLERMRASLKALFIPHELPGETELRRVILDVALANGLSGETARVNLFCYQDAPEGDASLCVMVAAHSIDRDAERRLTVYPHAHVSHLCAHKTMANLHQRLAWNHAHRAGFDDAALTDGEGRVLESALAALLFSDGHGFFASRTPHKLPSLTMEAARAHLPVEEIEIPLAELPRFRHAYWLNSLGGIQPIVRVDSIKYDPDWKTCRPLLRDLLGLEE
jgi:4-amino-4-deoxychorismate lyase